ncbi:hypothetical protein DMH20_02645 [Escherichia coli]|nr:hypothetical protein [Escherichia coli]
MPRGIHHIRTLFRLKGVRVTDDNPVWIFIDSSRCTGCKTCELACKDYKI